MAIPPVDDHVELIAHELEHVIEQLDDIDLRTLAKVPSSGVQALRGTRGSVRNGSGHPCRSRSQCTRCVGTAPEGRLEQQMSAATADEDSDGTADVKAQPEQQM